GLVGRRLRRRDDGGFGGGAVDAERDVRRRARAEVGLPVGAAGGSVARKLADRWRVRGAAQRSGDVDRDALGDGHVAAAAATAGTFRLVAVVDDLITADAAPRLHRDPADAAGLHHDGAAATAAARGITARRPARG